jgi:hypothetical protein
MQFNKSLGLEIKHIEVSFTAKSSLRKFNNFHMEVIIKEKGVISLVVRN